MQRSADMPTAFEKMDAMYRHQRYFYDATRKFYLLGRDQLIKQLDVQPLEHILEVGCGTGRNLIKLARDYPETNFYGLDASSSMLVTASSKLHATGLRNVSLETGLADDFEHKATFELDVPFDSIFFSYSISMIPTWKESLSRALTNLRPGGSLYIVDFYDQRELPGWFRMALKGWLRRFHVQFWGDLIPHLFDMDRNGLGNLEITPVARRYAFIAKFQTKKILTK